MSKISIDFNKINSKSYRMYRIMQSSDKWSKVYRRKIEMFESYRTAIIFPEALLGLNQKNVFGVVTGESFVSVTIRAIPVTEFRINGETFKSVSQLEETGDGRDLTITCYGLPPFETTPLFSGKKDAIKYAQKTLELKAMAQL